LRFRFAAVAVLLVLAAAAGPAPADDASPAVSGVPGIDLVAPRPSLRIISSDIDTLARTGHLVVRVRLNERGNGAVVARLQPGNIQTTAVEHGFPRAGRTTFVLRISRRGKALLRRAPRVTVRVKLAVEDMAGNRRLRRHRAVLRR
jgi:hypothetical protein